MNGRKIFNKQIVSTNKFLEMPTSAQALYFHLGMNSDKLGVVTSPKSVMRYLGTNQSSLDTLIENRFIKAIENGLYVVMNLDKKKEKYES